MDNVYIICNLINFVSLYRLRNNGAINIKPKHLIYHKVINKKFLNFNFDLIIIFFFLALIAARSFITASRYLVLFYNFFLLFLFSLIIK